MRNSFFFVSLALTLLFAACGSENTSTFQCPMKCEGTKTYDKAGKCPVCEMDLEQVETK